MYLFQEKTFPSQTGHLSSFTDTKEPMLKKGSGFERLTFLKLLFIASLPNTLEMLKYKNFLVSITPLSNIGLIIGKKNCKAKLLASDFRKRSVGHL
jgi:hypothetical protein